MSKPCSGPGMTSPSEVRRNRVKEPRIDPQAYVAWRAGTITLFVLLARQAKYAGGIDPFFELKSIPGLLKRLQNWAQENVDETGI